MIEPDRKPDLPQTPSSPGETLGGCAVGIVLLCFLGNCVWGGNDPPVAEPTSTAALSNATGVNSSQLLSPSNAKIAAVELNVYDEPLVRQATSVSNMSGGSGDGLAAILNLNGELCAKSLSGEPMKKKHHYAIICKTHIDGPGYSRYDLNVKEGTAKLLHRSK